MIFLPRRLLAVAAFLIFVLSTGCGGPGKGTPLSGKLVLPKDMKLQKDDSVNITFVPDGGDVTRAATCKFNADDLSFVADTSETTGVLPGKYKITVSIIPYQGTLGSEARVRQINDGINKQFDETMTKLSYEVTAGGAKTITIDLAKSTITKN